LATRDSGAALHAQVMLSHACHKTRIVPSKPKNNLRLASLRAMTGPARAGGDPIRGVEALIDRRRSPIKALDQRSILMPIRKHLTDRAAFAPDTIAAMSKAFEEACISLKVFAGDEKGRKIVATRIIDLARSGLVDPKALRDRVHHLASFIRTMSRSRRPTQLNKGAQKQTIPRHDPDVAQLKIGRGGL
jgi:hypothetical protein